MRISSSTLLDAWLAVLFVVLPTAGGYALGGIGFALFCLVFTAVFFWVASRIRARLERPGE